MPIDINGGTDKVDHGDINAIDGAGVLTAMAWVRHDVATGANRYGVWAKSATPGTTFQCALGQTGNGGVIATWDGSGSNATLAVGTVPANEWHHLCQWWDGSQGVNTDKGKLYVDGVSQTITWPVGGPTATVIPSNAESWIYGWTYDLRFDGKIALSRVCTTALTTDEISREMRSYLPRRRTNLILDVPYDDGTHARDYSGVGNHGTVTGATQGGGAPPTGYAGLHLGSARIMRPRQLRS